MRDDVLPYTAKVACKNKKCARSVQWYIDKEFAHTEMDVFLSIYCKKHDNGFNKVPRGKKYPTNKLLKVFSGSASPIDVRLREEILNTISKRELKQRRKLFTDTVKIHKTVKQLSFKTLVLSKKIKRKEKWFNTPCGWRKPWDKNPSKASSKVRQVA